MIKLKICNKRYYDKEDHKKKHCNTKYLDKCEMCQIRDEQHYWDNRYKRNVYNPELVLDMEA